MNDNDLGLPWPFARKDDNNAIDHLEHPDLRFGDALLEKIIKIWKPQDRAPGIIEASIEIARNNRRQHPLNDESVAVMSVSQVLVLLQDEDLDERTFENISYYFCTSPSVRPICLQHSHLSPDTIAYFFGMESELKFGYATSLHEVRWLLEHPLMPLWIESQDEHLELGLTRMLVDHTQAFLRSVFRNRAEEGEDSDSLVHKSVSNRRARSAVRHVLRLFPTFSEFSLDIGDEQYPVDLMERMVDFDANILLKMSVFETFFSYLMDEHFEIPRPDWMKST